MNIKIRIGIAAAACLVGATNVLAAESAADAARRCGQILGERERLACFDRAFPAGPETAALAESRAAAPVAAAAVVAAPVAAAVAAPAAVTPVITAPVAAAPVAAAPVVAAPVAAAVATSAVAAPTLGDEQVRKSSAAKEAAASEPKSLTARVTSLKETREDVWRFNLDNGQVWQQMDMAETFHPAVGDTVEIQRKMMGGYTLGLSGGKSSRWVRVTRVQ